MTEDADHDRDEAGTGPEDDRRTVDIEDQGQAVEAPDAVDPDVEDVDADARNPGPEGAGAAEATRTGDEPTAAAPDEDGGTAPEG